ncbi:helix-turn-helix domain-containing protein [Fodinibius sp. AD559]|uniref:helix-turn-helix domain-containing protein n=1 Tax=Fodinibius sp. AD559 TaxID=3424179 RepID=UPI004046B7CD
MGTNNYILHIKNMVCPRCHYVVEDLLKGLGYTVKAVDLGQAVISSQNNPDWQKINEALDKHGFGVLRSKIEQEAERIKVLLIHLFYYQNYPVKSDSIAIYLELAMSRDIKELDKVFQSVNDLSIVDYTNKLRFERAKELVSYDEQPLEDIANRLGYANADRLGNEFKKKLNISIHEFSMRADFRRSLDKLI